MWKFSIRELFLVVTAACLALAANIWTNRDLKDRLELAEDHIIKLELYADKLHRNLGYAKQQSDQADSQIHYWMKSGELKLRPREPGCGDGPVSPDWTILNSGPPTNG